MKKKQTWLQTMAAVTLATSAILPVGISASAEEQATTETEQLIVKYKTDQTLSKNQMKSIGVKAVEEQDQLALYDIKKEVMGETIEKFEKMDNVEYVEKNVTYKIEETAETNDTYYKSQWNLSAIDVQNGWESVKDYRDTVKVAVLDTGVQGTHEDLAGRVLDEKTFVDGYDDKFQGDDQGHGTFVSGIIAANANNEKGIAGVAGNAHINILPVKVMNKSGVGDAFNIAKGIDYAVEQDVDVINMSLSGEYSESVEEAVKRATDKGIVVVAASGNGGGNADSSYPAALPNVLSVGAIATKDQVYERSNYGSTLDLVAPGVSVLSTSLTGDLGTDAGHYSTGSGTSYAAPHVAAIAALYKLKHPQATTSEVEEALTSTATDLNEEGWDEKTGYGKLNANAALADDIAITPLSFVLPKNNANIVGTTTLQVAINDTNTIKTVFYADEVNEANVIGSVETANQTSAQFKWDTTKVGDGVHHIIAMAIDTNGQEVSRTQTSVKVMNAPQSGYMFTVKTPSGTIAKGATVKLYEKVTDEKSNTYSYSELWSGATDVEGALRVPSNVGTDLKTLQVVVQGKFDAKDETNGNAWFMYSREVASLGAVTLESDNTVPVTLNTLDETGAEVPSAQYFVAIKDSNNVTLGSTTTINDVTATEAPTVYVDKGAYNMFSYHKNDGKTYYLSNTAVNVSTDSKTVTFDSREAGQVSIDNSDKGLENGILYLYNDEMTEAIGSDEVVTGREFYVTPGNYEYMVDAEVKGADGKENWVYVFANEKTKAVVKKGRSTVIKAGGSLDITKFEPDQESLKRYYIQRGLTYIERPYPNIAYKLDQAFYTTQVFGDDYGNKLVGMYRGSLNSDDALYKKDLITGKTTSTQHDEVQIETKDFGDIYAKYKVTRQSDGKTMLDSYAKNPTNPANRQYYMYSFWVVTSSDVVKGKYDISLTLDNNPLAKGELHKSITIDMQDTGTTMKVKNAKGENVAAYITINRLEQDSNGDYEWVSDYARNTDTSKSLSIPSNLELSDIKGGNVVIIRYLQPTGEYSYIYRSFDKLEELDTIQIPGNMKKVSVKAMNGASKIDNISTKLWMIKKEVTVGNTKTYVTANNLQIYKYDSIYLEPDNYVFEGNYVTLPDENNKKENYYFLNSDVKVSESGTNEVIFNKEDLAKVEINADATGYKDVRGVIVYPYNQYSDSFIKTLRVGHTFYVPANLEMDLQVQLGLGDMESNNYIWNYFLTKGEQTFQKGQQVNWQVGGDFKANIALSKTKLLTGDKLSGHTSIEDGYGNTVSSVLVNQTTDYSIADDALVAYEKQANGQIVEKTVKSDYTISDDATTVSASSVKPVLRIYDTAGKKIFENASLDYYGHIYDTTLSLADGQYRAELALAASPKGPIVTAKDTGLFRIGEDVIPTVSEVTETFTSVTGTAEIGTIISVKVGTTVLGTAKTGMDGKYSVPILKQKAGTNLTVIATDAAGNSSETVTVTVKRKDTTAPSTPKVNEVTDQSTSVTGLAEAGSAITVKAGSTILGAATATIEGKYTVTIAKQKEGTKLTVIATDTSGNVSKATNVIVQDKTAPTAPRVNPISDQDKIVTGTAEAGSTVIVKAAGNKKNYKATVKKDGTYKVTIAAQKAGTIVEVTAIDKNGNVSSPTSETIQDKTAPAVPKVNVVNDQDEIVTGTAEANSTVTVKVGNTVLGTAAATSQGKYTATIDKQKEGTLLTVTATDAAGNTSKAGETKVTDGTAPVAPTVNPLTDQDKIVSGTAEAGSIVTVKVGNKKTYKTTAKKDGAYKVTIAVQKAGTILEVTATDKKGNVSIPTIVIVQEKAGLAKLKIHS